MLNEDTDIEIFKNFQKKVTAQNVLFFYSISKIFYFARIGEFSLRYIERCFPMIVDTRNFLHLDFIIIEKLLGSSELNIHSEAEVIIAAISWLKHSSEERSKFARKLSLKIRSTFMSVDALKRVLSCSSSVNETNISTDVLKHIFFNNINNKSEHLRNRYCSQENINMLLCGGNETESRLFSKSAILIGGRDLKEVKVLPSMSKLAYSKVVRVRGELFVFGNGLVENSLVYKYSLSTGEWTKVARMVDNRINYCACAFMRKIFIIGGSYFPSRLLPLYNRTSTCFQFDARLEKWKEVRGMSGPRVWCECAVYRGRVVVCGGQFKQLTVESYDPFADRWSHMPQLTFPYCKSLVVARDKLFAFGRGQCAVLGSGSGKFVAVKASLSLDDVRMAVSVGNRITIFQNMTSSVICYDVGKDKWSKEQCEAAKNVIFFTCVKLPCC